MNIALKIDEFLTNYKHPNPRKYGLKFNRQGTWTQNYAYFIVEVVQRGFLEDWDDERDILDHFKEELERVVPDAEVRASYGAGDFEIITKDNKNFHKLHEDVLEEIAVRYDYCMFFPHKKA